MRIVRCGGNGRRWGLGVGLIALALLGSCKSFLDPYPPPQVISETNFDPSLGIDLSKMTVTASGLYYQDIVVGDGAQVGPTDTVKVDYAAWLSDGTPVDSGTDVALPVLRVIPGMAEGLVGMKEGGSGSSSSPRTWPTGTWETARSPAERSSSSTWWSNRLRA